jgi:hypothetical protein
LLHHRVAGSQRYFKVWCFFCLEFFTIPAHSDTVVVNMDRSGIGNYEKLAVLKMSDIVIINKHHYFRHRLSPLVVVQLNRIGGFTSSPYSYLLPFPWIFWSSR